MKKQVSLVLIALLVSSMLRGSSVTSIGGGSSGGLTSPVGISDGGTGQTSAQAAIDALLPSQGSANGKYLTSNGTNSSWGALSAVTGPGSSTDGNISTWNGAGGATLRSEAKMNVSATTGAISHTFASTPTYLSTMDVSTATGWGAVRYVTGTVAATGSDLYVDDQDFSYGLASGKKFVGRYYHPTFSSTTNERVAADFISLSAAASQAGWGGWQVSSYGVFGGIARVYNSSTSGAAGAYVGTAQGNQAIGLRGVGVANIGSSGKAAGVSGTASTTGSAAIAVGGYFALDANHDTGTETEVFPSVSGALVTDTGDVAATIPAFIALNNGSSVFQVQNNGRTVIGANGGTARHELNCATQTAGSSTGTLGTAFPTAAAPYAFVKMMVNGREVFFPVWATP